MPKRFNSNKTKKTVLALGILVIIIVIISALVPFITAYINDINNSRIWNGGGTDFISDNRTISGNITQKNPNYAVNTTNNRQYTIADASFVDYSYAGYNKVWGIIKTPAKTVFGEDYAGNTIKIFVTDYNGTPLTGISIILTAWAEDTAPPIINLGIQDKIMLFDNSIVTLNDGDNRNMIDFGDGWGGIPEDIGWYNNRHIAISLTYDTLSEWEDFAVTMDINFKYNAYIYIRLVNVNRQLLDIQEGLKTDTEIQGFKTVETFNSLGVWDGNYIGVEDMFYALDTANLTDNFYKPKVSTYDNNVYRIKETRLVGTKDLTNLDQDSIQPYYMLYDLDNTYLAPETYQNKVTIYDMDNSTTVSALESNTYYNFITEFTFNSDSRGYRYISVIGYTGLGANVEFLGITNCTFGHESYITSFTHKYNIYYSANNQEVHRTLYDNNDKMEIMVDMNTPLYLNATYSYFKIKYMLSMPNEDMLIQYDQFRFNVYLEIVGDNETIYTANQNVALGYDSIGRADFTANLISSNLQDLTSYQINIYCYSLEDTGGGAGRLSAVYTHCLYYIFRDFDSFMTDVKDMEELIAALKVPSDIGAGTYGQISNIMEAMKPKIKDLEASMDDLETNNPDRNSDLSQKVRDSIEWYKTYYLLVKQFTEGNPYTNVASDSAKFLELKGYLQCIQFWYADSFSQYNGYVAALNGEYQIRDDFGNISQGSRDKFIQKGNGDKQNLNLKWLPYLVILLDILISFILSAIVYLLFIKKNIKNKWLKVLAFVMVFVVLFLIIYIVMINIGETILMWYYGI